MTVNCRKNTFDFSNVIGDEIAICDPGLPDSMYDVPGSTLCKFGVRKKSFASLEFIKSCRQQFFVRFMD